MNDTCQKCGIPKERHYGGGGWLPHSFASRPAETVPYETPTERRIRIAQYSLAVVVILITAAGIALGLWGLSLPDPSAANL